MSETARCRWIVVLCLGLAPAYVIASPGDDAVVVVRVYGGAQTDATLRAQAIQQASDILGETGLTVAFHDCTGDASRRQCDHLRAVRTLVVRIAPTLVPGTPESRGSIRTRAGGDAAGLILGFAVVEPSSGDGVMATVFLDRVQSVAQRAGIAAPSLLGRAIAHEVGHLLLASNAHSTSGLMREIWSDAELAVGRREDWLFTPDDVGTLHHNLQRLAKPIAIVNR